MLLEVPELREVLPWDLDSVAAAAGAGAGRLLLLLGFLSDGVRGRECELCGERACAGDGGSAPAAAASSVCAAELDACRRGDAGEWGKWCCAGCGGGDAGEGGYQGKGWRRFEWGCFGLGIWSEKAREAAEVSVATIVIGGDLRFWLGLCSWVEL